jgi:hypothetical protein
MLLIVDPAAPGAASSALSTVLDVVDKVVKVVAVLIAGLWGYLNYRRGRTFERRLEPRISGKVFRSHEAWLLCGLAQLKNIGLSKVTIEQKGTAMVIDDLLLVKDPTGAPRVESERIAVLEVFKAHGWIEPGELTEKSFLHALPERANRAAVRLRLRIVSSGIEWNDDTIAEIVQESAKPEPPKPATQPLTQKSEKPQHTDRVEPQKLPVRD